MENGAIWLVEDEEDILALIYYNLQKEGYLVTGFHSAEEMFAVADESLPDLLILDVMLPGIDGFEVCRRLKKKERFAGVPILMLTARGEESDIISGLELGADDYLTKPFSPRVLTARVKAVMRRTARQVVEIDNQIVLGDLVIDHDRHQATVAGSPMVLTSTEYKILALLAAKPGWVFSRDQIIAAVHDGSISVTDRTVDVHIASLRKKLGASQPLIESVRGVGYKVMQST